MRNLAYLAEGEGFEPPDRRNRSTVFKTRSGHGRFRLDKRFLAVERRLGASLRASPGDLSLGRTDPYPGPGELKREPAFNAPEPRARRSAQETCPAAGRLTLQEPAQRDRAANPLAHP